MKEETSVSDSDREHRESLSPEEKNRKQRVLTQGAPSAVKSIAEAIVIKDEDVFFLTKPDGNIPTEGGHGLGLYYHDCRFLNGYELKLAGTTPEALVSTAEAGFMAVFELTNEDIQRDDGGSISQQALGIKWERIIDGDRLALHDILTIQNFGHQKVELPISTTFQAAFEDVFTVRGLLPAKVGQLRQPEWKEGVLRFVYDGLDGLQRALTIYLSPPVQIAEKTTARWQFTLEPREIQQILISLFVTESQGPPDEQRQNPLTVQSIKSLANRPDRWTLNQTQIRSNNPLLNHVLHRSLQDLRILSSNLQNEEFFAAGVPWFATLFGRDSIITALQTLAYEPWIAEQSLRLLASYQGQRVDEWRDEQPGKILHELRVGELARLGEIPHTPYYGSIDATPLFLILVSQHAAWTGDLTLFNDLRGPIKRALEWISKFGDLDGDGYVEYQSRSKKGLINQGWKDSGDGIVNVDGSLATPPIALVEVQGYIYMAKMGLADLYQRAGDPEQASQLRKEANALRSRFNRDFWLEDKAFYALALEADNKPVAVISSNPGHALWSDIADPDKARRTVERLMADDLFNGWGVRTLSDQEQCYNPLGYHLGTVWPHDNSIIVTGFRKYGFDDAAARIFLAMVDAATYFDGYRLPELFAGFSRQEYGVPIHYPVACHPQAWAAGSVPYMLQSLLGLTPEAFERRLRIVRPVLLDGIDFIEVQRLKIGRARIDLRFERGHSNSVAVKVLKVDGQLDVVVELSGAAT